MRNLKRVLSLALALVMVLGMMVITTSAATFGDADEITYTEAMDVLSGVGLYQGDDKGNVNPQQILTRKDAATLVARIILGDKIASALSPTKQIFTDVPTDHWAAAAIEYCYNIGMIDGLGDGTFNPDGKLTGTAFAKLLLCAMGYDAAAEGYTGDKWSENINADALTADLMIKGVNIAADLTREGAAQMILQAMEGEMVEYTIAYDYATGAQIKVGPYAVTETVGTGRTAKEVPVLFMDAYFDGLAKIENVISDIDYKDGKTTVGTVTLTNTDGDWTNVGYAARAWYLEGKTATTGKALSLVITGEDVSVTTDGTKLTGNFSLTQEKNGVKPNPNYVGDLDAEVIYVLNGEVKTSATPIATAAAKTGVQIALVNNDRDAEIDAVVAVEYTAATVDRVLKKSVSGDVSIDAYKLSTVGTAVSAKKIVGVDELAAEDFVTYVELDGYYYVTVCTADVAEYEDKETEKLANGSAVVYYTIGGVEYAASELADNLSKAGLNRGYINEEIVYVLDQYGYIIFAAEYKDPYSFLYVVENERTGVLTDVAETVVVYVDGSVETIDVASADKDDTLYINQIAGDVIYTYTEKNGAYTLTTSEDYDIVTGDFETNDVSINGVGLSKYSEIIDIRDVLKGKADAGTVYVGYDELPSIVGAKIVYILNDYGNIDFGYLVAGTDASTAKVTFTVFNTDTTIVDSYKVAGVTHYTYELEAGVILEGDVVATENYVLTQAQKDAIDTYGVGTYTFKTVNKVTTFTYTSFYEDDVKWEPESNGTLIKDGSDITDDYTPVFLNIEDGKINDWDEYVAEGTYYAIFDDKNDIVYVVAEGTVATGPSFTGYDDRIYTAAEYKVTKVEAAPVGYTITLVDLVEGLTITADKALTGLAADTVVTLTVAVDEGYVMGDYYVTANNVLQTATSTNTYTLIVKSDVTVELDGAATKINCVVKENDTTKDTDNATVTPEAGSGYVMPYGSTYSFKVAADAGYTVTEVKADDTVLTAVEGVYSFVVKNNTVITVTTEANPVMVDVVVYDVDGVKLSNLCVPAVEVDYDSEFKFALSDATYMYQIVGEGSVFVAGAEQAVKVEGADAAEGEMTIEVTAYTADKAVVGTNAPGGMISITGGKFNPAPDASLLIEGYVAVLGADGYWQVLPFAE